MGISVYGWLYLNKETSICLNFRLILCMLVFFLCNYWMVATAALLHFIKCFKFEWPPLIKDLISYIRTGFNLEIRNSICCIRKGHYLHYIFNIFNKINMDSVQRPSAAVVQNSPGKFLLLIRWKVLARLV